MGLLSNVGRSSTKRQPGSPDGCLSDHVLLRMRQLGSLRGAKPSQSATAATSHPIPPPSAVSREPRDGKMLQ